MFRIGLLMSSDYKKEPIGKAKTQMMVRHSHNLEHGAAGVFSDRAEMDILGWEWDLKTKSFKWSRGSFDGPQGEAFESFSGPEPFLRLFHPSDRSGVLEHFGSALAGFLGEGEFRLLLPTGGPLRVRSRMLPICSRSGDVIRVLGLCYSTTDALSHDWYPNQLLLLAQAEQIADFGTWEFDVNSRSGTLSAHLAQMLDVPSGTLSEVDYCQKVHPDDRSHVLQAVSAAVGERKPFQYVARYFPPTGGIRHHFVRGIPSIGKDGQVRSIVGITLDFSDQTHAETELHRLSQKLLRARDEERRTVARELHESTSQTLAAIKMSLGRLREALSEGDDALHGLLQSSVALTEEAIREVRTLSYLMHPPMLDEAGLRSALRWYAKGFSERSGISVQVDIPEDFGRYGQQLETTIFRIVQEALTNVHRYSGSRSATIQLSRDDVFICAIVKDEGCGLPGPGLVNRRIPPGVGIVGMRERVKQLSGRFEIESAPGKGTTVRVALPIENGQDIIPGAGIVGDDV